MVQSYSMQNINKYLNEYRAMEVALWTPKSQKIPRTPKILIVNFGTAKVHYLTEYFRLHNGKKLFPTLPF